MSFAHRFLSASVLLVAGSVCCCFAQSVDASVSGTVRDVTGSALAEASVEVKSTETGWLRKLVTDEAGRYSVLSVPVGNYRVSAAKDGFALQVKTGVSLAVGQQGVVDFTLPVGELNQTVTVEESASPVNVSTQSTAGLVSERQVKDLPLNGRSFDLLMTMNPSVVNYASGRSGGVGTSNSALGNMFSVSGRRPQENLYLLNGIEYTGASLINVTPGGASGQLLGVDAVREFNVVSDTYGVEYGKRPGGQVSIVTASGTNQVHGSLYEFLRNSSLDARNFFDQGPVPQFQRNDFGASLGGPVRRDKAFFFGNYEGFRQRLALSDVTLVPDNNARLGYLPTASGGLTNVGVAPGVAPLLSLWPVQNGPEVGGGIAVAYSNPKQAVREDFGTSRFDLNLSNNDTLAAVYTVDDSGDTTPSINPLSSAIEQLREQVASVQEQHVFSPNLINTARFGYSRAAFFFDGVTPVDLPGWVSGRPIGAVVIGGGTALNGASSLSLAGTNAGSNLRAVRNLFTAEDHANWTRGRHQIEAGFWLQRIQANDNLAQYQNGQASFSSLQTFLQGTASTFTSIPSPTELGWRSVEAAGFVQDTFRVRPNLEVRVGFRFESTNGWNEVAGRAANYLFDSNGVIQTQPRISSSAFTKNRAKFLPEPRVGIAWDPFGKSATVIHAGFGIYRGLLDTLDYRLDQTAPFNTTVAQKNIPVTALQITPGTAPPAGAKVAPSGIQPDAFTPTLLSWSFKVDQQLAAGTSLSVGYLGSHGYHEILSANANAPYPTILPKGTLYYAPGSPFANPNVANTTTWFSNGISAYHALQLDLSRRFAHGLQFRGVYTWSKSLDAGSAWNSSVGSNAPGFVMYPANPKLDWGPSNSDVRHLAAINGTYELPFGRSLSGWQKKVGDGWSVSGIATLQSGLPFTPSLGYNPTNNGDSRNPIRPSWNPAFTGPVILGQPGRYYDPNAFVNPAPGTYGNTGRNVLTGPGLVNVDVSAAKNTQLRERLNLQFRAEVFNVLNRANFGIPNTVVFTSAGTVPSPTAGVITSTATSSRQIQFGLKLLW